MSRRTDDLLDLGVRAYNALVEWRRTTPPDGPDPDIRAIRARALVGAGSLAWVQCDAGAARSLLEAGLTLGQALGIPGVTPAAVSLVNVYIEIQGRQRQTVGAD